MLFRSLNYISGVSAGSGKEGSKYDEEGQQTEEQGAA